MPLYYLGQAVQFKRTISSKPLAAILLGYSQQFGTSNMPPSPIISFLRDDGSVAHKERVWTQDLSYVRENSPDSPTKKQIYYGSLSRGVILDNVTIKTPEEAILIAELNKIKEIIETKE